MGAAFLLKGHIFLFYKIWSEENRRNAPMAFHLYLSIFHFGQIKGKPWEKLGQQLVLPFGPRAKTKRTLNGSHLRLVAIWDLVFRSLS